MRPTHLDLFSGIGGFTLAAESAGFETIGFSEIEPYASAVLKKHWPNIPNYGDVRTVPAIKCDLVTGGFPCQPFSCTGKRQGAEDDRFLWPAMLDVIARCQPTWLLGENVAGIINMELDRCCSDLEAIGYEVQPIVIPACGVGAWHLRERIWIIANSKRSRLPQGVQSEVGTKLSPKMGCNGFENTKWSTWDCSPELPMLAYGLSDQLDAPATIALGNAIVPQVAEVIIKAIREIML